MNEYGISEVLPGVILLPFSVHSDQMDCALALDKPTTCETAYLGGIEIIIGTWSVCR